jgi:ATPase subunit of ABC transporter with duplicated ATPase domains
MPWSGPNGCGKTTLLSDLLAGELQLQGGMRQMLGGTRIQLLRQETSTLEPEGDDPRPLLEIVAERAFAHEREIERELEDLARRLEAGADLQGAQLDSGDRPSRASCRPSSNGSAATRSSRGSKARCAEWACRRRPGTGASRRCRAASADAEPWPRRCCARRTCCCWTSPRTTSTWNRASGWRAFWSSIPGAALVVSHDRQFLDRVATRTLHLDRGRLVSYSGNYSFYDEQSRLRYQQDLAAWEKQQTRFRQTEEYIRRNIEGQKTRQAQARRKQMAKEEKLERPSAEPGLFRFKLEPARPSGGTVLQLEGLSKAFGARPAAERAGPARFPGASASASWAPTAAASPPC